MDNRTTYSRIKRMLEGVKKKVVSKDELDTLIAIHIGSTPRSIENALRTMAMTGLIKDIGNFRFEIIKEKIFDDPYTKEYYKARGLKEPQEKTTTLD